MSVSILGEDGKPVEPEAPQEGPEPQPQPEEAPHLLQVVVAVKADGNLSITGPPDHRIVLRMLHEASDIVLMGATSKYVLEQIASAPVQRPGLRDVLAFSKVRPK